jgi:hypothetical protein
MSGGRETEEVLFVAFVPLWRGMKGGGAGERVEWKSGNLKGCS